ncbi:BREX-1 system adenine-specific DNA-methyltransferase PglX [Desulfobacterales bacterium HSG17]|nr:BREX-1 system adenine-specific DNA-methyltransferase PglX [Desulfobacterales bacterium HSG17]
METSKLKTFAQYARRALLELIENKLVFVLSPDSLARRENPKAVAELEKQIQAGTKEAVIEKAAYTWFNRFCALRFMDVNQYNRVGVLSPADGQIQPEILAEAKMGVMDENMIPADVQTRVSDLLGERIPSHDSQNEAYALIIVAVCNYWNRVMPFMFERIADFTELLMPDDLVSDNSLPALIREAMSPDVCEDVEVIGWLYQFYVSEKKDEVFAGLKKNKKITPENIPAATQLFTPEWIVKYLVENSLGRLWMLNRPGSRLVHRMEYYIKPDQEETDFLRVSSPEEIKVCDPACGSGHMLVYAFELLYAIYEEEGYDGTEIPGLILGKNLFGIEIDERAGGLACFALVMKARGKYRRFFRKAVQPKVCVLENVLFITTNDMNNTNEEFFKTEDENGLIQIIMELCKTGVDRNALIHDLYLFTEADNFGSLLKPELSPHDFEKLIPAAEDLEKEYFSDVFLSPLTKKISLALKQGYFLSSKYHVVIANPPYMGGKGMNGSLGTWAKENYPNSKSDLFAMFIERGFKLLVDMGYNAMITMQSWMFLSSFETLRQKLLTNQNIVSLIQIGYNSFPELNSKVAQACAFILVNCQRYTVGSYINLNDVSQSADKEKIFIEKKKKKDIHWVNQQDFSKIPGSPIAYWVSEKLVEIYSNSKQFHDIADSIQGMITGNNNKFLRRWPEVNSTKLSLNKALIDDVDTINSFWIPYNKGGDLRKWYGNNEFVLNWSNKGKDLTRSRTKNAQFYFKPCITWTFITSSFFTARKCTQGFVWDVAGSSVFPHQNDYFGKLLCFMCSKIGKTILDAINPTLNYQVENILSLPVHINLDSNNNRITQLMELLVITTRTDWDSYETSWDFKTLSLLQSDYRQPTLKTTYTTLRTHWQEITLETQRLEQENNRIFIEAYGLQDELTPEVPLAEITLTCNPHYRYGGKKTDEELEKLLLADTIKEFISYAVGCIFGRFSLDKPGLILANQGETIEDYLAQIPKPTFAPAKDNVIPIMDNDWFTDDITEQFKTFLKTTFGLENYTENLAFIENAIGKNISQYFLKNFYPDHIKTYKKRPIYWMFSSPKASFNALIYMHRYRPDTASIVLNNYLREYTTKLGARKENLENISISAAASQKEKTKAIKEIEKTKKIIEELNTYERETLYPLAAKQMEIDLDNGVKQNYPKFGKALKKVTGLS